MNHIELEQKIKKILMIENYFDMVIAAKEFEKEYKSTEFFKLTKKPLAEVLKESKIYYALQLNDLNKKIQDIINSLDMTKIEDLLDQAGELFSKENTEIANFSKEISSLLK